MNINNKKKQLKKEVKENKRGMNLKILRILLIALSLIIILMNFVSAVTNVTNCSTLSTANTYYQLNRSIVDIDIALSTDCIIISAQNITFDCNGYYISQSENVSGIYSNQYNTTIRNCNITIGGIVGSNSEAKGIELVSGTSYGTIYNNTARADVGYGIYLTSSASNNLTSNIGISTSGSGIFMTTNSNNNILINNSGISNSSIGLYLFSWAKNNILINNSGISNSSQGISLNSVCDNNILTSNIGTSISGIGIGIQSSSNNTLTSSTGTSNSSIGIYLLSSNNNTLTGNNGTSYATSGNVAGINIWASSSNNLTGNIGTGNKVSGIFFIYAENNILINSTGTSDSGNGIFVWDSSKNSILINNTGISNSGFGISLQSSSYSNLTGNIGTSNSSYGTAIWTASNNNLFSHRTEGYLTGSYGFYITSSSANNTIQDCINASGVLKDVFVGGNSVNNIFINCSYTLSKEQVDAGSYLTRKWFYKAYVNDSLFGTDISGANVSAYNVSSALEFFLLTNSSGWTNRTEITEYVNYGGTRNYYNNYTLSAEKTGYATSSKLYNVTNVNGTEGVNNYLGDYFSLSDNSAPNATLILANNTYASNYSVNFTANITDNVGIKNATLNVYNSTNNLVNQTNQSYSTGVVQSTLGIVITLINGVYKWFYEIFDWQGNQYTTANYTLNMYLVSDCQTLSTAGTTYYLNQSISNDTITGDCMIVSAQNITLDCQGYSIASIQNFSGVYSNQYNTTIRNCNVTMGGSSGSNTGAIGIEYVQGANYGTIYNNTAKSDIGTGISLKCISNSTMYNNTGTSNTGYGIVFSTDYCSGNNNNNITKNTGISNSSYGILIASAGYEYVDSNIGTSTSSYGIYYQNHNSIIRNNIGSSITSIGMGMIYSVANITFENNTGSSISSYGIDLFCANSTMTGNTGTSNTSTGIFIYSRDSIIKNNIGISNGSNGISFAGYGYGIKGTNLTLINNTGINAKYVTSSNQAGIYFWSDNSTLINNSGYGNGSTGIYIETGSNGNTLTNNFGFSNASYGIHIYQSPNTVLINNNGTSDATGSYRGGIFVSSSSNNNTLINNTGYVTKTGGATWSAGIYVNSNDNNLSNNIGVTLDLPGIAINGLNNIITNSNGTSNSSYGIYIWSSSNNTLTSSTGTSNSSFAIYLSSSSNNTLIGNTGTSNSNIALYLSNGDNNKFYNQTAINYLTGTNAYGIYMDTNSDNNIIQDCINVTGVKGDIFLITTSVNNTFINCSYRITGTNESVAAGSSLIRKWYYKAYVNDSNGTAISGANISAYNVSGTTEFTSLVTNSSGWTNRTEITEYVNYGGTRSYYNNYTINATYWSAKTGKFYNVSYSLNNLNDYLNLGNLNISSSLLMPANNTWSNNSNTNFTANVSTSIGVKNATVNIYNSLNSLVNQTSTTFAEGIVSSTFGIVVTLVDSVYKWFYSVFDWAGNQFTTENYTVNVDATYPQIDFTAPTPANSSGANTRFLANISLTELNLGNITYSWNGTNYTYGSNYTLFTPANLTEGLVLLMAMDNETSYGENSTYVVDFSGMGNNGTCSGTTCPNWSSAYGKLGAGGYSFDGVDDEINIPYSQSVNFSSNPFSISLWFNKIGNNGVSADSRGDLYSRNEFQHVLYISTGNIISFFWDNTDYDSGYTTTNNKYYHLVLSKNESNFTNLYIDGIFVISFNTTLKNMSTDNNMISIGGSVRYLNGSIDEVAIWNRSLSANEIKQLYESSLRKYSDQGTYLLSNFNQTSSTQNSTMKITSDDRINWKLLINQSGLVVGNRYNYFVSAVDLAGNVNTTETRTISGNMAPNAISVTPSPALAAFDDLDPGINFNVTANISDTDNNFDTAILQWKNSTIGSEWNNVTMNNITVKGYYTIVNANFTLPSYENNITYRIWINDTIGDANTSSNYTIQSFWDCTWTSTTDLGAAAGWDTNKWIGNISINNTGDVAYNASNCSLDFRLTYDITEGRIYYDNEYVKPSNTYTIPAKTNKSISINATLGTEIKQENVVITIDEFRLRSNTSSKNTTATLVTNQNGPYLYQKITGYSASVYLTAGNISLQGYLRNLMGSTTINETNTAYNVSFNWTIPAELENVSGNLSVYYENITESSMNYNNVNLGFSDLETATAGIKTIYLYAKGYNLSGSLISDANNNTLLSEKINISFLCYNVTDSVCVSDCGYTQDPDCSQPAATTTIISGGGGGGAGAKEEKSEAEYTLLSGKQQEFKLTIYNKLDSKKQDLKISVSGINSEYISISPNTISSIEPKGSKDVTVRITAPAYFTKGKYQLKFLIQGNIVSNQTKEEFKETRLVTIYIIEVSEAETNSLINDSLKMINEMNNSNMSIKEVSDLYSLMLENYNKKDYSGVKSNYEKLKQIHDNAFEALKIINELTKNLKEAETRGISILESKKLLYIAESAFSRGDYALALERLKEAKLSYALETKGEFNLIYEIKNHPVQYSFGTIMFILFSFGSSLIVRMNLYKRKLRMLGEEEKLLLELMKVVQRECFENNRMSMEEYETAMYQYESKLGETIGERIRIETKLAHMMKLKGNRRALDDEKKRLTEAIKKIQEDYIISGTIETRIYENMLKNYGKRLSEVEEEIVFIEAQEELNKNNLWNRMIRTISGGKNE